MFYTKNHFILFLSATTKGPSIALTPNFPKNGVANDWPPNSLQLLYIYTSVVLKTELLSYAVFLVVYLLAISLIRSKSEIVYIKPTLVTYQGPACNIHTNFCKKTCMFNKLSHLYRTAILKQTIGTFSKIPWRAHWQLTWTYLYLI